MCGIRETGLVREGGGAVWDDLLRCPVGKQASQCPLTWIRKDKVDWYVAFWTHGPQRLWVPVYKQSLPYDALEIAAGSEGFYPV